MTISSLGAGELVYRLLERDAGVVECDIEAAVCLDRSVNEVCDLVLQPHVGFHIQCFSAVGLDLPFEVSAECLAATTECDLCALMCKRLGRGAADPRGSPCDKHYLAVEPPRSPPRDFTSPSPFMISTKSDAVS